jgi:hypothetical protein
LREFKKNKEDNGPYWKLISKETFKKHNPTIMRGSKRAAKKQPHFGGPAIIAFALDPWLCVPGFHRVCHYRFSCLTNLIITLREIFAKYLFSSFFFTY